MGVLEAKQDRVTPVPNANGDLLVVRDLSVNFCLDHEREARVLKQVSFTIVPGEIVGLLGESGSGKTTTALSLICLLPECARIVAGSVRFCGQELLELERRRIRAIRGAEISIIHQDAHVLNPVMGVGTQVMEVLRSHKSGKATDMRDEIHSLFEALGLKDSDRIYRAFPHQLSGGERRRVAIAQALICKPRLVIADEPTAWLDSDTMFEILSVFRKLQKAYNTAFLLISHDPEALMMADRVLVMYAGEIVEDASRIEIFERPMHPYTSALFQCGGYGSASRCADSRPRSFPHIPGHAPDPSETQVGCSFSSRCFERSDECDLRRPELHRISSSRSVRCVQYEARS